MSRDPARRAEAEAARALQAAKNAAQAWDEFQEYEERRLKGWSHFSRRHKVSVVARTAEQMALPLHAKRVPALSLDRVMSLLPPGLRRRIQQLLCSTLVNSGGGHRLTAPAKDAEELVAAGYCSEWTPSGTAYSPVEYFTVEEAVKQRRRPIFWPKFLLQRSKYLSAFTLPSVSEYRRCVHDGEFAAAFDLAASFAQVELPEASNLVFKAENGKLYRLNRLPYGIDVAPEIMQIISEALGREAARGLDVKLKTHIDNVMAVGSQDAVAAWAAAFKRVAAGAGATLNVEEANTPAQQIDFVGIRFDFGAKTVALKQHFLAKVSNLEDVHSLERFESLMGRLTYAYAVLGRSWLPVYYVIQWWRRVLSRLAKGELRWTDEFKPPPFITRAVPRMIDAVRANEPAQVPLREAPQLTLATDASMSGWGAVLMRTGDLPLSFGSRYDEEPPNITWAETAAVVGALCRFEDDLAGRTFTLLIDNTSSEAVLRSQRPGTSPGHNAVALRVLQQLDHMRATMYVARVGTHDNVADEVSRGRPIVAAKAAHCLQLGIDYDWAKG